MKKLILLFPFLLLGCGKHTGPVTGPEGAKATAICDPSAEELVNVSGASEEVVVRKLLQLVSRSGGVGQLDCLDRSLEINCAQDSTCAIKVKGGQL